MTDDAHRSTHLRHARYTAAVAIVLPATLSFVWALLLIYLSQGTDSELGYPEGFWSGVVFLSSAGLARSSRHAPHSWPLVAGTTGGFAGLFAGAVASSSPNLSLPDMPGPAVVGIVAGVLAGWIPGRIARATVLKRYSATELADTKFELRFKSRGRVPKLRVDTSSVSLDQLLIHIYTMPTKLSCQLADVTGLAIRQITVSGEHAFPGERPLVVPLSPGPAVRFDTPEGEWIFPTDHARDVETVLRHRIDRIEADRVDDEPAEDATA